MAGEVGLSRARLIAALERRPQAFAFFQAVRLLDAAAARVARAEGRRAGGFGEDAHPQEESVRLAASVGLGFPASEISRVDTPEDKTAAPTLHADMFGLFGPSGVLPQHYTELAIRRRRRRDDTLTDFLDLFNHRSLSLYYRAWRKYRLAASYEAAPVEGADPISGVLKALAGLYGSAYARRCTTPDESLIGYAAHFGRRATAAGIERMIADATGLPAKVLEFQGSWIRIAPEERSRLGGAYCTLGSDAVAGAAYWDVQRKFRIRIGPVDAASFRSLVRTGGLRKRVSELVRLAVGPALDFDIAVVLKRDQIPVLRLGAGEGAPKMGRDAWLPAPSGRRGDPADAILPSAA